MTKQTPKKQTFVTVRISKKAHEVITARAKKERRTLVATVDILLGL